VGVPLVVPQGLSLTSVWQRPSVTFAVPASAVSAIVSFNFAGASGNTVVVDDGLLELGSTLQDYFDRHQQRDNVLYEAAVSASRLHFYRNRVPRLSRAEGLLQAYLPMNSQHQFLFAQPRA
jgi:hypothetical protein